MISDETIASIRIGGWLPVDDKAKSGACVLLLAAREPYTSYVGKWAPDGTSWVEGRLVRTGIWESEGGWFEPDEVTHWMPIPPPPAGDEA